MDTDDENEENIRPPDLNYIDQLVEPINLNDALYNNTNEIISDDPFEAEIQLAMQISREDCLNAIEDEIKELSLREEEERLRVLEISNRITSLENFTKNLNRLMYSEEDKALKKYIENILNEYFQLNVDYHYVDDEMYDKLYKLIDSYYLIPSKKNRKTLISENEDFIIRSIFLKKI
jgi:hypothetical protein